MAVNYGSLPFAEQIEFFRRKLNVNTQAWTDVLEAEHDVAFMVAGANRDDLVADFREAVRKAIEDGATLEDFRKDFDRIVTTHGWDYNGGRNWRSRVIYETNLRQSYNAGRWAQLQKLGLPYWRYRHNDAVETPRPLHQSWDKLVLVANDPWWHTHYPANGWGCQCYVEGISERDLRRLGKSGPDSAPPVNMQTVTIGQKSTGGPRTVQTPEGVDPGFGYAPGRSAGVDPPIPVEGPEPSELAGVLERTAQQALEKTMQLPITQSAKGADDVLALPRVQHAIDAGFWQWAADAANALARASSYTVGAIEPPVATALVQTGIEPSTAAVIVREAQLASALATPTPGALTVAELVRLPALLRAPVAVLLNRAEQSLLYVSDAGVVVTLDYSVALPGAANAYRSAARVDLDTLRKQVGDGLLQLLQGSLD